MSFLADAQYAEFLPADLALDPSHPANDNYLRAIQKIRNVIVMQTMRMHPNHVEVIKQAHRGVDVKDIAEAVGLTPETVRNIQKREKGQRLRALLIHLDQALDGPSEAQRKNMLWRIAVKNEEEDPRVAISSVDSLNKMDQAAKQMVAQSTGNMPINITINTELMPRTVLDG